MTNRLKMTVAVLIAGLLTANPAGPFASAQTPRKDSPADVVLRFVKAMKEADLKVLKAHRLKGADELTQKEADMTAKMVKGQTISLQSAWQTHTHHKALVITSNVTITPPAPGGAELPKETRRFALFLDDTLGDWLIENLEVLTDEEATEAVTKFRDRYEDAREVPKPHRTPRRDLTVFHIRYADAKTLAATIDELFNVSPVVDERSNSLFLRYDDEEETAEITEVLRILDQPDEEFQKLPARQKTAPKSKPAGGPALPEVTSEAIEILRRELADIESQAADKARRLREMVTQKGQPLEMEKLRIELQRQVELAFAVRQKLQQTELIAIRERLARVEKQIEAREQVRDRIIKRRLEELLDPTLQWATEELAGAPSVERSNEKKKGGTNPMAALLGGPSGIEQSVSPQSLVQSGGSTKPIPGSTDAKLIDAQVLFRNPEGLKIVWSAFQKDNTQLVPARLNLKSGRQHGFMLTSLPGREGLELAGSIEVAAMTNSSKAFLSHNAIPVEFTEEDFDQVASGNLVTKVVYLPAPDFQEQAIAGVEMLVSTRMDPGMDPVVEGAKRGQILAVLRLGNRVKAATLIDAPKSSEEELELEARIEDGFGILFFNSESCPVCEKVKPDFTREMSRLGLPSLSIDVLKFPNIAKRFRVSATPTFVFYGTEVERGRATGAEFLPLVEKFKEIWEETDGARSGLGFGGGLPGFLRRELVKAQTSHESLMTDITSLDLTITELGDAVRIPAGATIEERKKLEQDELRRKAKIRDILERIELFKDELRPIEARMRLIRQRLKELESGNASTNTDPRDTAVWIEAIIERKGKNGQIDAEARYMNGTIVSSDGLIAFWLGHGSTMADAVKFLRKITVQVGDTSHTGKLFAYDSQTGAAIIRIDAVGLPFVPISEDPIATNRRLTVHARFAGGEKPMPVTLPVSVIASRFKLGDHDGFFAVTEASQNSISSEYAGAPIVTASGQLQGILAENERILFGPAIKPEDPQPRRAAAIPASVIRKLLKQTEKPKEVNTVLPAPGTPDGTGKPLGNPGTPAK